MDVGLDPAGGADHVDRRRDLSLPADDQTLRIGADVHFLMADRRAAQKDRVARGLLRRRGEREEQQKRPSTMENAHCSRNRIS